MCCTHLSGVFRRLNMPAVSCFEHFLCPVSEDGIISEGGTFEKYTCQKIAESTEIETHLSITFLKKDFGRILRPESVRRKLITWLIYGPRANKQFNIALFWTLSDHLRHSDSLNF